MFAAQVGKFICASAGPNHGRCSPPTGSGAVSLSTANGWKLLNVDIGGGTTKFAVIKRR